MGRRTPGAHGQRGARSAGKTQRNTLLNVRAQPVLNAHAPNPLHVSLQCQACQRKRVNAYVQQRAAAQRGLRDAGDIRHGLTQHSRHQARRAQPPVRQRFAQSLRKRQRTRPHGFRQQQAALPRQGKQALRLGRVQRQGLFAQHMFARKQRRADVLCVQRMDAADVNDVHGRVGQQRLISGKTFCKAVPPGQGLGPRAVPGRNGVRLHLIPQAVQRARHAPGNVSRRKDREIQHCSPPSFVPRSIFSMGLPLANSSMSLSR